MTIACLLLGFAANAQSEADIKKAFNAAFAIAAASDHATIAIPGEYVYKDGKLTGQKFFKEYFSDGFNMTNEGVAGYYMAGSEIEVTLKVGSCSYNHPDITSYAITYNDNGQAIKAEQKHWGSNYSNYSLRYAYTFEYSGNKIAKVTRTDTYGSGKHVSDRKPEFEYLSSEIVYTWKNDNEVEKVVTSYTEKKKAKDKQVVTNVSKSTLYAAPGKGSVIETQAGSLVTRKSERAGNEATSAYEDDRGNKTVEVYTVDGKGKPLKLVKTEYKNGTLDRKIEGDINYTWFSKTDTSLCSAVKKNFYRIYDSSGNLIEEATSQGRRAKNPDGTWGPWRTYTY